MPNLLISYARFYSRMFLWDILYIYLSEPIFQGDYIIQYTPSDPIKVPLEQQLSWSRWKSTLASFNRQFGLKAPEKEAVDWAWPMEMGDSMFNVVNGYTRAAQQDELTAESSFRLSKVGGNILGILQ